VQAESLTQFRIRPADEFARMYADDAIREETVDGEHHIISVEQ
jgi:hypothetical protein